MLDGYKFIGTNAEFIKLALIEFAKTKCIKINIDDSESVINKDKSETWVSLWYDQVTESKDSKIDIISFFNDFNIKKQ